MRRLQTFFLLLCLTLSLQAQTFYEVNYTDDGVEYLGLMIYYNDDNCKMRLITPESLEAGTVFESPYLNMIEEKSDEEDVGIMAYYPVEKKFPVFLWFWEEDDASDISEKPFVTYNIKKTNSYIETEYFNEISLESMDETYISQFYGEDEPEYRMMLNGIQLVKNQNVPHQDIEVTVDDPIFTDIENDPDIPVNEGENIAPGEGGNTLGTGSADAAPTLHLIVVANTNVSDIGSACAKDLVNLNSEFGGIARVLGMKYDFKGIRGKNYSKDNLAQLIRNFQPNSDDVVIFVYTGHGFRFDDQQDYYPNICMIGPEDDVYGNYVATTDIYNAIKAKGARLSVVITDCCNSKFGEYGPRQKENTLYSRTNTRVSKKRMQELFLGTKGVILATAAKPGEYAWSFDGTGSAFTQSFIAQLRKEASATQTEAPNWQRLVDNAIESARRKTTSCENTQHGMRYMSISKK